MNILNIFTNTYIKKLEKFENIMNYNSNYQAIYNEIINLVKKNSYINMQTIELIL